MLRETAVRPSERSSACSQEAATLWHDDDACATTRSFLLRKHATAPSSRRGQLIDRVYTTASSADMYTRPTDPNKGSENFSKTRFNSLL